MLSAWAVMSVVLLSVSFVLYVSGLRVSHATPERVTELWHLDSKSFRDASRRPTGWSWLGEIETGWGMTIAALSLVSLSAVGSLVPLVPAFGKKRDTWYVYITTLLLFALVVAASGIATLH